MRTDRLTLPAADFLPRLSLQRLIERVLAADALHRQIVALGTLDDRMLGDLGLTRADVRNELLARRRSLPWV